MKMDQPPKLSAGENEATEAKLKKALQKCAVHLKALRRKVAAKRAESKSALCDYYERQTGAKNTDHLNLNVTRELVGHFGRCHALSWGMDPSHLLTGSQDGTLIRWNTMTGERSAIIRLSNAWVMTVGLSTDGMNAISGGLDNLVSLFNCEECTIEENQQHPRQPQLKLEFHEGYVADMQFIRSNSQILSASGDSSAVLWSIEKQCPISVFEKHVSDVESVHFCEVNNLVLTGSCDLSCALWDLRSAKKDHCIHLFKGHTADINDARWFKNGHTFISGSDDTSCGVFDIRCLAQLNSLMDPSVTGCVYSVSVRRGFL